MKSLIACKRTVALTKSLHFYGERFNPSLPGNARRQLVRLGLYTVCIAPGLYAGLRLHDHYGFGVIFQKRYGGDGGMKIVFSTLSLVLAYVTSLCFEIPLSLRQIAVFAAFMLFNLIGYGEALWEAALSTRKLRLPAPAERSGAADETRSGSTEREHAVMIEGEQAPPGSRT